jgi:phage shock protein A
MIGQATVETDSPEAFVEELERLQERLPQRIEASPQNVEKGLAKLVLTLIELIRQLLEKQAIRRMEAGSLSDDQIENMGLTLMKLENKMKELQAVFGLKDEDLNINLGPLGDLL